MHLVMWRLSYCLLSASLQCSIDLKKSVLLIGTTGSETRFLPEGELPECARLAYGPEGRDEPRPEEIADRELAEAIQRSVQESGEEHALQGEGVGSGRVLVQGYFVDQFLKQSK